MRQHLKALMRDDGMTILELMIVLVIMSLVGVVATVQVAQFLDRGKTEVAELQLRQIDNALQMFQIDVRRYPTDAEGLAVLLGRPEGADGWRGPYLRSAEQLTDPWGKLVGYDVAESGTYVLTSLGADRKAGGSGNDADIALVQGL